MKSKESKDKTPKTITGYNLEGKKVIKHLEKGESPSGERCPICNSMTVEDYYDAPYRNVRCIICCETFPIGKYNTKGAIKQISKDIEFYITYLDHYNSLLKTLKEENNVRKLNGKIDPNLEKSKK